MIPSHVGPRPAGAPPLLELHEKSRLNAAAGIARRELPGAIGELVSRELLAAAEFGVAFGLDSLYSRVVDDLTAGRIRPDVDAAAAAS